MAWPLIVALVPKQARNGRQEDFRAGIRSLLSVLRLSCARLGADLVCDRASSGRGGLVAEPDVAQRASRGRPLLSNPRCSARATVIAHRDLVVAARGCHPAGG